MPPRSDKAPPSRPPASSRYRDAGVDLTAGRDLIRRIAPLAASTARPGADATLGGFGGMFDLAALKMRDPVLVAATDGVGTKLKLAIDAGQNRQLGIDLVAMSVNDLAVQGATPLFFLDYFATGQLDPAVAEEVVTGIAEGCRQAGCALIGGETAEMPGLYAAGDYDLAGFAVGAVERDGLLPRPDITAGDILLGLESDGVHANGFSLVRRLLEENTLAHGDPFPPSPEKTIADELLRPTRIYSPALLAAIKTGAAIKGAAHITGGGLPENLPRALPEGLSARLEASSWPLPPVFDWLRTLGNLRQTDMTATFNCGLGMVIVAAESAVDSVIPVLEAHGERVHRVGEVVPGAGVAIVGEPGGAA